MAFNVLGAHLRSQPTHFHTNPSIPSTPNYLQQTRVNQVLAAIMMAALKMILLLLVAVVLALTTVDAEG